MSIRSLFTVACLLSLIPMNGALARDQWSINHGMTNPPADPRYLPGGAFSGYVPSMNGTDFWKGQLANRVPIGTVLTAILEDDVSSGKNRVGDTFVMTLDDGFGAGGRYLIPPRSKILGTVINVTSAKMQRNGRPGNMEVSLQSLVLPDGSHYPISAIIDGNPNHNHAKPPKKRNAGVAIADYGQSVAGMAMSFVTGPGYMMKKLNKGLEFQMDKGDAIPIRLTRSLDITPPQGNVASGPVQIPGFVPAPTGNAAGQMSTSQLPLPPVAPPMVAPPRQVAADPNAVFNTTPAAPQQMNQFPDPF